MERASEALHALKPVTFRYKKRIDPQGIPQFGLVAEDVEKVNADLVRDKEGKPYSVRYEAVNAMLLNEFLKEYQKVQQLEANDVQQQNAIKTLTAMVKEQAAQIQKVNAQLAAANGAAGMRSDIDGSRREAGMSGRELVSPSGGGLELNEFATGRIRRGRPAPLTMLTNR